MTYKKQRIFTAQLLVKDLKEKGVKFENYDNQDLKTDKNNITRGNGPTNAWFTDPAGNILALIEIGAD